eukprot:5772523-Pyramimonas_sp.AAC.1
MGTYYRGKIRGWVKVNKALQQEIAARNANEVRSQIGGGVLSSQMSFADGRPVWTNSIWREMQELLQSGKSVAPKTYKGSHTDVAKALRYYKQTLMPKRKGTPLTKYYALFDEVIHTQRFRLGRSTRRYRLVSCEVLAVLTVQECTRRRETR